jgi:hypothetical protein
LWRQNEICGLSQGKHVQMLAAPLPAAVRGGQEDVVMHIVRNDPIDQVANSETLADGESAMMQGAGGWARVREELERVLSREIVFHGSQILIQKSALHRVPQEDYKEYNSP